MSTLNARSLFVWLNIFFQMLVPVSAEMHSYPSESKVYHLKYGETPAIIAAKAGVSLEELERLNIHHTKESFSELVAGDELMIPKSAFLFNEEEERPLLDEATTANLAKKFGNTLTGSSKNDVGDIAADIALKSATQAASQTSEAWLGQFGTARVKLGVDDKFSLEGTEFDLLAPMYDSGRELWFAQSGFRYIDHRSTLNLGVGMRSFIIDKWMLGGNIFFDNDLTGHNRRLGIGTEAWTDYVKLSGNVYHALTDWHQSRDLEDYDERPADGFDIRTEAYLPRFPQVGGKLMFEQYYGDDVALFGKGDGERQRNPHAVTAGVNYTPFPLLTTSLEHRIGSGGINDTSIALNLNYQIGIPLDKQLYSENVASRRMLAGSRLDLVDRNNLIVLEYKKHELITASLPPSVEGESAGRVVVNLSVTSKYALKEVRWDSTSLVSAGGVLTAQGIDALELQLPLYQEPSSGAASDPNRYTLGAVAYDIKGNVSEHVTTTVIVSRANGLTISDMTIEVDNALADGTAKNKVQVKLSRSDGSPASNEQVTFSADNGAIVNGTNPVNTDTSGLAIIELTSLTVGQSNVTATLNNAISKSRRVTFAPVATIQSITAGGYTFANNVGFPTTGFKGAQFTLNLNVGNTSDYTWTSDASWVSVSNGIVTFSQEGTGNSVTITGTPKSGRGNAVHYSFTISNWFINAGANYGDYNYAINYCGNLGYSVPNSNLVTSDYYNPSRGVGSLWSEWGALNSYAGSGFLPYTSNVPTSGVYRVAEITPPYGNGYGIRLEFGTVYYITIGNESNVVCYKKYN